jgi:hypothetical protein
MAQPLSNRVWILLLAAFVGAVVACSSSSSTPTEEKDAGGVKPMEDAAHSATKS